MSTVIETQFAVLPGGVLENGPLYLIIKNQNISAIQKQRPAEPHNHFIQSYLITPGFIDIHTHGLGGADEVTEFWLNPNYTLQLLPNKGTTSCLATLVFPKDFKTSQFSEILSRSIGKITPGSAVLEGIHAEGPVVNDCGGLPESNHDISISDFHFLINNLPSLKLMTISPHIEAQHNYKRMKALIDKGITPCLGHDRVATEDEILGALRLSTNPLHITHVFNVSSFHHRLPSLVNFGLTKRYPKIDKYEGIVSPTIEIIGDLAHVHPITLSAIIQARGYHDICFITDSVYDSSKPDDSISYNGRKLVVSQNGLNMVIEGTNTIAGSCCSMIDIFHNLIKILNVPVNEAVTMLTENPARVARLHHTGLLKEGKRADILLFDETHKLIHTIIAGETAWKYSK